MSLPGRSSRAALTPPPIPTQHDLTTPDVQEAERILRSSKRRWGALSDLSAIPRHHVTDHDGERARNTVEGLKGLGLLPADARSPRRRLAAGPPCVDAKG